MSEYDNYQHYMHGAMAFVIKKKMLGYDMNKLDREFSDLFRDSMLVYNSFERMSLIFSLIENIPDKTFFDDREILEDEYLKYHIENYHVCSISMLDKLANLINTILGLQLNEKDCSFNKLTGKHKTLLPDDILKILTDLKSNTSSLRKYRNHIVHEGDFHDDDWFMLSGLSFLSRRGNLNVSDSQLSNEIEKEFGKYTEFFKKQNEVMSSGVFDILKILSPILKDKANRTMNGSSEEELIHIAKELGLDNANK